MPMPMTIEIRDLPKQCQWLNLGIIIGSSQTRPAQTVETTGSRGVGESGNWETRIRGVIQLQLQLQLQLGWVTLPGSLLVRLGLVITEVGIDFLKG